MKTQHDKTSPSTISHATDKAQVSADAKPADSAPVTPTSPSTSPIPQKIWDDLHENLTQALGRWEHLSEEADRKVSPEEAQLQEVKRLLDELKNKLREFSR